MSNEITTADDDTPPTPFPLLLGRAAMLAVAAGVLALFGMVFIHESGILFGALCGLVAIILGIMTARHPRADAACGNYATGAIIGGILVILAVGFFAFVATTASRRGGSPRSIDVNNTQQIGIGIQYVNDALDELPTAVYDPVGVGYPAGKGLSWRVGLLAFIEEEPLYRKFDFTEPWDSTNNRALGQQRVRRYENHYEMNTPNTRWQAFVGPGAVFDPSVRLSLSKIPDGLETTAMIAEAATPVAWPTPFDLAYAPNAPLPALGHPSQKQILTLMADGSVRRVSKGVSPAVWHAVIQRADGAKVDADWWKD